MNTLSPGSLHPAVRLNLIAEKAFGVHGVLVPLRRMDDLRMREF